MMKQRKSTPSSPNLPRESSSSTQPFATLLPLTTQPHQFSNNNFHDSDRKRRGNHSNTTQYFVQKVLVCIVAIVLLYWIYLQRSSTSIRWNDLESYTPILRHDISKEDWSLGDVIHIVNTRLMQEQGSLIALGEARLALFRVFCLPTMQQQSTQNFIWIIKVDPELDVRLLSQLVQDVQRAFPQHNAYVVGSNENFRINEKFPGAWRDGAEVRDLMHSRIYTGNRTLLETAMALSDHFPILETRLDADDGLHIHFTETIQKMATSQFKQHPNLQWMYWCSRRHIEWHWMDDHRAQSANNKKPNSMDESLWSMLHTYGAVLGIQHSKLCITPGITTGFALGTREANVPVFAHDELIKKIRGLDNRDSTEAEEEDVPGCGLAHRADCLQFIEEFVFEAIRSRSPTSAGMARIQITDNELYDQWWVNYAFWNMIHESFRISRPNLKWIHQYLSDHLIDIARDNLVGQCTTGHSCKESAKQELERLIQSRMEHSLSNNTS